MVDLKRIGYLSTGPSFVGRWVVDGQEHDAILKSRQAFQVPLVDFLDQGHATTYTKS